MGILELQEVEVEVEVKYLPYAGGGGFTIFVLGVLPLSNVKPSNKCGFLPVCDLVIRLLGEKMWSFIYRSTASANVMIYIRTRTPAGRGKITVIRFIYRQPVTIFLRRKTKVMLSKMNEIYIQPYPTMYY